MKKMNKKGFTIVELVIVIAVIAILAAVLIPTFTGIIKKANISADTQLVRNLNTALAEDKAINGEHKTMQSALDAAVEGGYIVARINAKATGNEILWDSVADAFCYLNDGKVEYTPDVTGEKAKDTEQYKLWKIDSVPNTTYSTYLYNIGDETEFNIQTGIDVGNENVTSISYDRTGGTGATTSQKVVIRTNSYDTVLTINAPLDTVKHYDQAKRVDVTAVAMHSYHEFGDVLGNINLTAGNVVVEEGCKASAVVIDMTAAQLATVTRLSADNSKAPEVPIILRTTENLWATNEHNDLINPETNNIIYAMPEGSLPADFNQKTIEERENLESFAEHYVAVDFKNGTNEYVYYKDIKQAFSDLKDNNTIKLLEDVDATNDPSLYSVFYNIYNRHITIDLGGHTLKTLDFYVVFKVLNITNGKWILSGSKAVDRTNNGTFTIMGSGSDTASSTEVTLSQNAEISSEDDGYGFYIHEQSGKLCYGVTVNIHGKYTAKCLFVSGNIGNDQSSSGSLVMSNHMPKINVYDGADISGEIGLLINGMCELNVYGGKITGSNPINPKRGYINIYGGEIHCVNDSYVDPTTITANGNGSENVGAGIGITSTYNYAGAICVNITGGKIYCDNGHALVAASTVFSSKQETEFTPGAIDISISGGEFISADGKNSLYVKETVGNGFITGGTYSTKPNAEWIASGYTAKQNSNGTWIVVKN